jgi:DNA replication protein DnaC
MTNDDFNAVQNKPNSNPCQRCGVMIEPIYIKVTNKWKHNQLCEECNKKIEAEKQLQEQKRKLQEERKAIRQHHKSKAEQLKQNIAEQIPPLYRGSRLKHLRDELQDALLIPDSVYLWGGVGTGKTYSAMALARAEIAAGKDVQVTAFEELTAKIKDFNKHAENYHVEPLCNADLLILDDIAISGTDFNGRVLLRIIDSRLMNMRKTVITSNLTIEALVVFYGALGQRIKSRLQTYRIIQISGQDRRRKA